MYQLLISSLDTINQERGLGSAAAAAAAAKSLQSFPTLCDPTDGSPPGSAVLGILQAGTLEWGAIAFSEGVLRGKQFDREFRRVEPGPQAPAVLL